MREVVVSPSAARDINALLDWSERHFGVDAAQRYRALIIHCLVVLREDELSNAETLRIGKQLFRRFHLFSVRNQVPKSVGRVKSPRHFVVYREPADGIVEVVRVLHERMDFNTRLESEQ